MNEIEILPRELKRLLDQGEKLTLVDVREPWEFEICHIEGAKLIPMRTIPANLASFDGEKEVICYCHHGQRSMDAAFWLRSQGIDNVKSLAGGIERWSVEIDSKVPRY